jgi:hypothetical protein
MDNCLKKKAGMTQMTIEEPSVQGQSFNVSSFVGGSPVSRNKPNKETNITFDDMLGDKNSFEIKKEFSSQFEVTHDSKQQAANYNAIDKWSVPPSLEVKPQQTHPVRDSNLAAMQRPRLSYPVNTMAHGTQIHGLRGSALRLPNHNVIRIQSQEFKQRNGNH